MPIALSTQVSTTLDVPHLPILRFGNSYRSLDTITVKNHKTGTSCALVSQANAGILRKDLRQIKKAKHALAQFTTEQLIDLSAKAADLFLNGTLPLGDLGHTQSPQQYIETLSQTSGLPQVMIQRNMQKIHYALTAMKTILNGLTRGLDLSILDLGHGKQQGATVAYYSTTDVLGLVMPSNSPAVNSLWLPAIALKTPVLIKPGKDEPWTPYRLIQAFIQAGIPSAAFGFYPTDHEGAGEVIRLSGRSLVFGDINTVKQHASNPAVQVHGPGWSKIFIGNDEIENWPKYLDTLISSISDNGGRSCINTSTIIVPKYGREIASALAERLAQFEPRSNEDPEAKLSGFANPQMADSIDKTITEDLKTPGAEDMTALYRQGSRKVEFQGGLYLKPSIIWCSDPQHPLANREFLCPYASVLEIKEEQMLENLNYTLVATLISKSQSLIQSFMSHPSIDRLNIGPVSTMKISWDQPHEGNLFEFLYARRSFDIGW
jgi:acyl-CoA reductase-like NAD-dependent aldehyde dehydrogenase